jgi:hypothetical protein
MLLGCRNIPYSNEEELVLGCYFSLNTPNKPKAIVFKYSPSKLSIAQGAAERK